jgi:hypothetical protein
VHVSQYSAAASAFRIHAEQCRGYDKTEKVYLEEGSVVQQARIDLCRGLVATAHHKDLC